MTRSKENGKLNSLDSVIGNLENTASQVEHLLKEIQLSESNYKSTNQNLQKLSQDVKALNTILQGENSPLALITRVAVLEERLEALKEGIRNSNALLVIDKTGRWKLWTAVATGIIGFATAVISMLVQVLT